MLILSEGAGAASQLGEHALVIAPADIEGTAQAIYRALTMPLEERRRRADGLRQAVETDDVVLWFRRQIVDIIRHAIRDRPATEPVQLTPTADGDGLVAALSDSVVAAAKGDA